MTVKLTDGTTVTSADTLPKTLNTGDDPRYTLDADVWLELPIPGSGTRTWRRQLARAGQTVAGSTIEGWFSDAYGNNTGGETNDDADNGGNNDAGDTWTGTITGTIQGITGGVDEVEDWLPGPWTVAVDALDGDQRAIAFRDSSNHTITTETGATLTEVGEHYGYTNYTVRITDVGTGQYTDVAYSYLDGTVDGPVTEFTLTVS